MEIKSAQTIAVADDSAVGSSSSSGGGGLSWLVGEGGSLLGAGLRCCSARARLARASRAGHKPTPSRSALNPVKLAALFTSKESELSRRAAQIKRLAFVLHSGRRDQYARHLPFMQIKMVEALRLAQEVLQATDAANAAADPRQDPRTRLRGRAAYLYGQARAEAARCTPARPCDLTGSRCACALIGSVGVPHHACAARANISRASADTVAAGATRIGARSCDLMYPHALAATQVRAFHGRQASASSDAFLLLSACKFVDTAILLLPQHFFLHQWMFLRNLHAFRAKRAPDVGRRSVDAPPAGREKAAAEAVDFVPYLERWSTAAAAGAQSGALAAAPAHNVEQSGADYIPVADHLPVTGRRPLIRVRYLERPDALASVLAMAAERLAAVVPEEPDRAFMDRVLLSDFSELTDRFS